MASVHKAYAKDFGKIVPLLQEFHNPSLQDGGWKALFTHHWPVSQDHFGYYLEENGQVVGFLGTIFSKRSIKDQPHRFCNLSTWIVKQEFRGSSLMLLFEVLKLKGYTVTNFTANRVAPILKKVGFRDLSERLHIFYPVPNMKDPFSRWMFRTDLKSIEAGIRGESALVFQHHRGLKCSHVLIEDTSDQCYIVYDTVKKKRLPAARIHHISKPEFFARYAHRFALPFCVKTRHFGMIVPENLLKGQKDQPSQIIAQRQSLLFKTDSLAAEEIDTLYSELQILGLRT